MKSTIMGDSETNKLYKIKNGSYYSIGKLWILYRHLYAYDNELIIKNAKKFFAIKHVLDEYFMEHEYENNLSFRTSFLDEYTCVPCEIRRKRSLYSFDGKCIGNINVYSWFHHHTIETIIEEYLDDESVIEIIMKSDLDKDVKDILVSIVNGLIDVNDKNIYEMRWIAEQLTRAFFYYNNREYIESDILEYDVEFNAIDIACAFLVLLKNKFPSHIPFNITQYTTTVTIPHVMHVDQLLFTDTLMNNMKSSNKDILSALLANDDKLLNDLCESGSSLLCKSLPQ